MDEQTREVLEIIAAELEKLRMLKEHELGAKVVQDGEGNIWVRTLERD